MTAIAELHTDPERVNSFTPALAAENEYAGSRPTLEVLSFPQD